MFQLVPSKDSVSDWKEILFDFGETLSDFGKFLICYSVGDGK